MNINPITGRVCHGIGGGSCSIDNVAFGRGGVGGWISETEVLIRNADDAGVDPVVPWAVAVYDTVTGLTRRLINVSANFLYADGGGHWAIWYGGIYASSGWTDLDGGLLSIGRDGTIVYKPQYQSNGPTVGRELDGSEFHVCDGSANDGAQVVGHRQVVFSADGAGNGITTIGGLPACLSIEGNLWRPRAAFAGGQWWITYYSEKAGIVVHPFGSFEGFSILPKGDGWHSMAAIGPEIIRVIVSRHEGEAPGDLWGYDINVVTRAVTPWEHSVDAPFTPVPVSDCRTINTVIVPPPPPPPLPARFAVTVHQFTERGHVPLKVSARYTVEGAPGAVTVMLTLDGHVVDSSDQVAGAIDHTVTQAGEYSLGLTVSSLGRTTKTGKVRIVSALPALPPPPEIPGITFPSQPGSGTAEGARHPHQDAADAARTEESGS